jgi:hypothetical protein
MAEKDTKIYLTKDKKFFYKPTGMFMWQDLYDDMPETDKVLVDKAESAKNPKYRFNKKNIKKGRKILYIVVNDKGKEKIIALYILRHKAIPYTSISDKSARKPFSQFVKAVARRPKLTYEDDSGGDVSGSINIFKTGNISDEDRERQLEQLVSEAFDKVTLTHRTLMKFGVQNKELLINMFPVRGSSMFFDVDSPMMHRLYKIAKKVFTIWGKFVTIEPERPYNIILLNTTQFDLVEGFYQRNIVSINDNEYTMALLLINTFKKNFLAPNFAHEFSHFVFDEFIKKEANLPFYRKLVMFYVIMKVIANVSKNNLSNKFVNVDSIEFDIPRIAEIVVKASKKLNTLTLLEVVQTKEDIEFIKLATFEIAEYYKQIKDKPDFIYKTNMLPTLYSFTDAEEFYCEMIGEIFSPARDTYYTNVFYLLNKIINK